jgi:hypothetical protein
MINYIFNIITTKESNPYFKKNNILEDAIYLYNRLLVFKLINTSTRKFNIDLLLYHLYNIEEYIKINKINIDDVNELNKIINISSNGIISLRTDFYLDNSIFTDKDKLFQVIKYIISNKQHCPFFKKQFNDEYIKMIIYFLKYFNLINKNTNINDLEIILYHLNNVIDELINNNIDIIKFKSKIINCIREKNNNNIILKTNFNECILDINIRRRLLNFFI